LNASHPHPPKKAREKTPNHEPSWLSVTSPSRNPHDGGMYIYHALAFNTLLSSQETDAHHHRILIQYPGQPLNFTPEYLSCQLRFPELTGRLLTLRSSGRPQLTPASLANNARPTARGLLGGSPGPGPAFRRAVPLGARRTLRLPQTLVKSRIPDWPRSSRNLRITHLTCGGTQDSSVPEPLPRPVRRDFALRGLDNDRATGLIPGAL